MKEVTKLLYEAINILEDIDPDQLNFDGVAIEETMQNEGIEVVEDTDYLIDNPGNQVWNVDPSNESSTGGYFNVPNRMNEDDYLMMCRKLNLIQRIEYSNTPYTVSRLTSNFLCISILEEVLESLRVLLSELFMKDWSGISIHYLVRTQMPLRYYWQLLLAKQLITSMV